MPVPLLKRLSISIQDLEQAKSFIDSLSDGAGELDTTVVEALEIGAIVAYSRPFKRNRTDGRHPVQSRITFDDLWPEGDVNSRRLHERLLNRRDQEMAHSDAQAYAIRLSIPIEGVVGSISRDPFVPIPSGELAAFKDLCSAMLARAYDVRQELALKMAPGSY